MKTSYSVILLMAGSSTRFNKQLVDYKNKSLYELNNKPLFIYSVSKFLQIEEIDKIYIVVKEEEKNIIKSILHDYGYTSPIIIIGGNQRFESVKNAIKHVSSDYCIIHDVARPLTNILDIKELIKITTKCGTLYHKLSDTIKEVNNNKVKHLDRNLLRAVTTPQIFHKSQYQTILNNTFDITDELSLFNDDEITFVEETTNNMKVTSFSDYEYLNYLLIKDQKFKIGHSYDYHNFKENEKLILGGILIPSDFGLEGYSDADVVYHSVCEAILGALGLGDIGKIFPDTDIKNYKRNSLDFINFALEKLDEYGYAINNIDIMIYLQKPNLKDYKEHIINNLKCVLKTNDVNLKATTLEKQGLIGTSKGIGTETVVLIKKK